jgi:hypothetical protein
MMSTTEKEEKSTTANGEMIGVKGPKGKGCELCLRVLGK